MKKTILLVEDEEHDILFMRLALEDAGVENKLAVLQTGREAIQYLKGEEKFSDRRKYPLPGLVLLDLRLPYVPGLDVLKWIRQEGGFPSLPVIVFSASNQESDVERAYDLGANAYVVKPAYNELLQIVRRIKKYWLDMDAPPPGCQEWLAITVRPPGQRKLA